MISVVQAEFSSEKIKLKNWYEIELTTSIFPVTTLN